MVHLKKSYPQDDESPQIDLARLIGQVVDDEIQPALPAQGAIDKGVNQRAIGARQGSEAWFGLIQPVVQGIPTVIGMAQEVKGDLAGGTHGLTHFEAFK
ncbi:MAG: hypothetical protein HZB87_00015 [Desulfatitalea sp.]|nr:hypothetical protein [Desulfatitalea sp.]